MTVDAPVTGYSCDVVTSEADLPGLASDWERLLAATPLGSAFDSPAWVRACWEHARGRDHTLRVAVVAESGRPVAIFPMKLSRSGRLSFVGAPLSNYSGAVFLPDALEPAVATWSHELTRHRDVRAVDLLGLREGSPLLDLLASRRLGGWGDAVAVKRYSCPEVDLTPGWQELLGRHKAKTRSTWRRRWRRLADLGELSFEETAEPSEIGTALPRLFELFEARWHGKRISGGFLPSLQPLHLSVSGDLARSGHLLCSWLRLDGEIVAFNYGLRSAGTTTCLALAHDARLSQHSPGLLLLLRLLESACERGDPSYDFSLGDHPYKATWATGERAVMRLMFGRGRRWHAARVRTRTALAAVPALRRAKVDGLGALLPWRRAPSGE